MEKKTATEKIRITTCDRVEGPLYRVMGEDQELYVYDTTVVATAWDGRRFAHKTFIVRGWVAGPDGRCPNRDANRRSVRLS